MEEKVEKIEEQIKMEAECGKAKSPKTPIENRWNIEISDKPSEA